MSRRQKLLFILAGSLFGSLIAIAMSDLVEVYDIPGVNATVIKVLGQTVHYEISFGDSQEDEKRSRWLSNAVPIAFVVLCALFFAYAAYLISEFLALFSSDAPKEPEVRIPRIVRLCGLAGFAIGILLSAYPALLTCYRPWNPVTAQVRHNLTAHPIRGEAEWIKHSKLDVKLFGRWHYRQDSTNDRASERLARILHWIAPATLVVVVSVVFSGIGRLVAKWHCRTGE